MNSEIFSADQPLLKKKEQKTLFKINFTWV